MSGAAYLDPNFGWQPAPPEPLWVGLFLRVPSCCGIRFRKGNAEQRLLAYETHWFKTHRDGDT